MGDSWKFYRAISDARNNKINHIKEYLAVHYKKTKNLSNDYLVEQTAHHIAFHVFERDIAYEPINKTLNILEKDNMLEAAYLFSFINGLHQELFYARCWCRYDTPSQLINQPNRQAQLTQRLQLLQKLCKLTDLKTMENPGQNTRKLPSVEHMLEILKTVHSTLNSSDNKNILYDNFRYGKLEGLRQATSLIFKSLVSFGTWFTPYSMKGIFKIRSTINDTRMEAVKNCFEDNNRYKKVFGIPHEDIANMSTFSKLKWPMLAALSAGFSPIYGGIAFCFAVVSQPVRNVFKSQSLKLYQKKTHEQLDNLTDSEREAFKIGMNASKHTSSLLFSCISPTALLCPKAYYAGYAAEASNENPELIYTVKHRVNFPR